MSLSNISLIIIALGLWVSIFVVRFRDNIYEWFVNRYGPEKPPQLPADGISEVSLPFRYVSSPQPPQADSAISEKSAREDESRE